MNLNKRYRRFFVACATVTILMSAFASGCSSRTATETSTSGQPASTGPAPVAKPGAKVGENNPAPGQPNHMSPEMQAQLQRYQSQTNK